ncbi:ATP-binding protein [Ruegeria arenilitoris]|uniref:ATP-binding protein n=1 Tax=Ruegeria arenilitoris TaxID=1173585 RepID=UPI00147A065C|nr:ATP-binding protein [Ruegeria arenilitoris]
MSLRRSESQLSKGPVEHHHNTKKFGREARVSLLVQDIRIAINIDDDGSGVPQDRLEKIFAPFVRLDSALTPKALQ